MITKCSVLLVDDDAELLAIFSRRFQRRGYSVMAVCQPSLAREAVRQQQFQVAVLDRTLPEQDGLELMQCLKQLDPDLPVILLSGLDSTEAVSQALERGAFAHLTKPCRLSELEATAEKACAERAVAEGVAVAPGLHGRSSPPG